MFQLLAQTAQDFTYTTTDVDTGYLGMSLAAIFIIGIVLYLVSAFIVGKMFQKADRPMWAAFVPIYNTWVLFEIAGKPGWWALVSLIPYVGGVIFFVLYIIAALELAKRFGKSTVFAIFGLIIFSLIGYIILAFDSSEYKVTASEPTTPEPPYPSVTPSAPTPQQ